MDDFGDNAPAPIQLTDRERELVKLAVNQAVKQITTDFYATVGKGVLTKLFAVIGLLAVGYLSHKWGIKVPLGE